jgi:hypothetical protein
LSRRKIKYGRDAKSGRFALDVNAELLAPLWRLGATASGIKVSSGGRELLVLDEPQTFYDRNGRT